MAENNIPGEGAENDSRGGDTNNDGATAPAAGAR